MLQEIPFVEHVRYRDRERFILRGYVTCIHVKFEDTAKRKKDEDKIDEGDRGDLSFECARKLSTLSQPTGAIMRAGYCSCRRLLRIVAESCLDKISEFSPAPLYANWTTNICDFICRCSAARVETDDDRIIPRTHNNDKIKQQVTTSVEINAE